MFNSDRTIGASSTSPKRRKTEPEPPKNTTEKPADRLTSEWPDLDRSTRPVTPAGPMSTSMPAPQHKSENASGIPADYRKILPDEFPSPGIKLNEKLSTGGNSVIYRGTSDDRTQVLKVPKSIIRLGNGDLLVRSTELQALKNEAAIYEALSNRPPPSDFFLQSGGLVLSEEGLPGLLLQDIPGAMDLRAFMRMAREEMSGHEFQDTCVYLLDQLLHMSTTLRDKGILNTDIKPENILVTPDGRFLMIDFGTSCDLLSPGKPDLNQAELLSTPGYSAPEFALGDFTDDQAPARIMDSAYVSSLFAFTTEYMSTLRDIKQREASGGTRALRSPVPFSGGDPSLTERQQIAQLFRPALVLKALKKPPQHRCRDEQGLIDRYHASLDEFINNIRSNLGGSITDFIRSTARLEPESRPSLEALSKHPLFKKLLSPERSRNLIELLMFRIQGRMNHKAAGSQTLLQGSSSST